jgi:acetyltransferase
VIELIEALKYFFEPKSVAVVGASRDPSSVGYGLLKSLATGCFMDSGYCRPFKGKIFPVNPHATELMGFKCFPSLKEVPDEIDLAIIVVPARIVPQVAREAGEKGVKALLVVAAGFAEAGEAGAALQQELVDACRKYGMRLVGPNSLGLLRPPASLNASFAVSSPPAGDVAFISQSGALADSVIDWAIKERYSFSAIASVGNSADLNASDFVEWAAQDSFTKVITLYLEGIADGRRFMRVCAKAAKKKPVLLLKAGRNAVGVKAVTSHTASIAGDYSVWKGAMKQAGVIMVDCLEDLFDLAKVLAEQPKPKTNSFAIITNGGGAGALCADYCNEFGVNLAELKPSTIAKLEATGLMHSAWSKRNPVDLIGDALPDRYKAAVEILLSEPYISGLIVIQTLQTMTNSVEDARVIVQARKKHPDKPIVSVFMGGKFSEKGISLLHENKLPDFNDPKKAARAAAALAGTLQQARER